MFWGNCDCIGTDIIMNASTKVCMYWGGGGEASMCVMGCSYWGKNAVIGARMHVHSSYQKHCDLGHALYPCTITIACYHGPHVKYRRNPR